MNTENIKTADDVRKVFTDVVTAVRANEKTTADLAEQMPEMRKDLEKALEAQKQLREAGRPQPNGYGHIKAPSTLEGNPSKMASWAAKQDWADFQGDSAASLKRFQEAQDAVATQFFIAKALMRKFDNSPEQKEWFKEKILGGEVYQEYIGRTEALFAKNINTANTGEGLEWVPDEVKSSQFIDRVRDAALFAGKFTQFTMTGKRFSVPSLGGDAGVFLVPELSTGRAGHPTTPESKPVSAEVIFLAGKIGVAALYSRESTEDMTIQTGTVIGNNVARNMGDTIDNATLFGDTDQSFHTNWGATAGVTIFDGLVKQASVNGHEAPAALAARLGWQALGDSLARMGQKAGSRFSMTNTGANGVGFWVSWPSFFHLVAEEDSTYGPSPIVTLNQYGPNATILDGEAARIFDKPIIPSEFVRTDLAATGAYTGTPDATGNDTCAVAANFGAWGLGTRRGMEMRTLTEVYAESDAIAIVSFWRGDFQPLQDITAEPIVDLIPGVKSA
jgi:HK97 family phage major capsid protein